MILSSETVCSSQYPEGSTLPSLPAESSSYADNSLVAPRPTNIPTVAQSTHNAQESALNWRIGMQLEDVQRIVALSHEEQQRLREALINQQQQRYSSAVRFDDAVRQAIGSDRMEQIRAGLAAQEQAEQEQRVQEETILLSRRLQLSGEQEVMLSQAIKQVELGLDQKRSTAAAVTENVMAKHMSGSPTDASRADMRAGYAQIKELNEGIKQERQAAMAESLKGILSPAQYDAWLTSVMTTQR